MYIYDIVCAVKDLKTFNKLSAQIKFKILYLLCEFTRSLTYSLPLCHHLRGRFTNDIGIVTEVKYGLSDKPCVNGSRISN